jgi:hypothetical protein
LGLGNEEDFQQMVEPIFDFLYKRFKGVLNNFYDSNFSDDDNLTYCFKKHKDLNPFGSRGFTSCVEGWNKMLAEYGYWLPDVNWPEVKEKLKQYPSDKNLLLAKPLQGHNYEYYFSISRK